MNEYDQADFNAVYEGKSLIASAEIVNVPWEIGEAQPLVCEILDKHSPCRVLDVGCGLGRNARAAYERGYKVVAIDISVAAIKQCQIYHSGSDIQFSVEDASATKFNEKFDLILDSACYHAISSEKRREYLEEMYRLATDISVFHLITFAPAKHGMPKPLSSELSEIARNIESASWKIEHVERSEYKGNAEAIKDFQQKKNLSIHHDEFGRTRLPVWHFILKKFL